MNRTWRRWGFSLTGLRKLDPPLGPPSTPAEFCWRTCLGEGQFWGSPILFYPKSYLFCDLKLHAKFQNPRTTPSGRKVTGGEDIFVCIATPRTAQLLYFKIQRENADKTCLHRHGNAVSITEGFVQIFGAKNVPEWSLCKKPKVQKLHSNLSSYVLLHYLVEWWAFSTFATLTTALDTL